MHRVRAGDGWLEVPVAGMQGEPLVVPTVAAIVSPDRRREHVLIQRRDKPGEVTRGMWEIPMGRWRAGERPSEAVAREVAEETGLEVVVVDVDAVEHEAHRGRRFMALRPAVVTVGVEGAYPALHLAFTCIATGEPRPAPGETSDPMWVELEDLKRMLDEKQLFTGVAYTILTTWMAGA